MIIASMLGWWYSRGWLWSAHQLFAVRLAKTYDFFSIGDLLKTLFAPFRQDAVDTKNAPVGVKLQVFGGNLISRFIGMLIRLTLIFFGLIVLLINAVAGFVALVIWPFVPVAPLVAILIMIGVA